MFSKRISKIALLCLLFIHIEATGYTGLESQDQTSPRSNTLFDDADDIQKQLDNEARDRIKFGRTLATESLEKEEDTETPPPCQDWDYSNQGKWLKTYPECGGKSQSPVDLPVSGLIKARGARSLLFQNYDVLPNTLSLMNDGKRVVLFGEWKSHQRPLIYGGAAHSRRYLFYSLTIHLPSEHSVGGLRYPLESQSLYISAEYKNMDEALNASPSDPQAFLGVVNLYKYSNHSHKGLEELLSTAKSMGVRNGTLKTKPLSHFNPPFKEYACYQGSMTTPPCTESVLWIVRGRTLSIMRETVEAAQALLATDIQPRQLLFRNIQPMNDRKVYLFN